MASNRKLKFRAGDMLRAKFANVSRSGYLLVLEAKWEGVDEFASAYYVLDLGTGEERDAYRRSIEHYYTKVV